MQVTVTLFGGLRHFLPAGSSFNKCRIEIDDGADLASLLSRIPIPPEKSYIVLLDDAKVSPEDYAGTEIRSDTDIVLLPPIKGG